MSESFFLEDWRNGDINNNNTCCEFPIAPVTNHHKLTALEQHTFIMLQGRKSAA